MEIQELVSIMGYKSNSPFRFNPYLDIKTEDGSITMVGVPHDLLGIDDKGNKKRMKAGSKNPYQFEGTTIREIPIAQMGGNPYSAQDLYNFIFEDEEEDAPKKEATPTPTAPSEEELQHQQEYAQFQQEKEAFEDQQTLALAMDPGDDSPLISPYGRSAPSKQPAFTLSENNNPYKAGSYGKQIIADLTQDLGYTPSLNSVYRTPQQQQALVAQGWGVPNSFHLTGDAVDMKPQDWKKLPQDRQKDLRAKYDVLYHNNHYHIEPRGLHPNNPYK